MSAFITDLVLRDIDGDQWALAGPLRYQSDLAGGIITAPNGRVTDLASIPQFVAGVLPRTGLWDAPAVIHDELYRSNGIVMVQRADGSFFAGRFDRETCDKILREAMIMRGVPERRVFEIYEGVRLGGMAAWDAHQKENRIQ